MMYVDIYWIRVCTELIYHKLRKYIEMNLSIPRLDHSLSTALICVDLCSRFGLDENKGRIAGISHDIARELPVDEKKMSSLQDGYPVSEEEKLNPVLFHGRVGADILKNKFKIKDDDILQAVRWHTAGHPDMGRLGQVLFIADFIEPGRAHITPSFRDMIMKLDLNEMTLKILNEQYTYLRDKGCRITKSSMLLYDKLSNAEKNTNA